MNSRPIRVRRSELATPAVSTKMIAKAASSKADLVFLDLEDAVAPAAKAPARKNIIAGLNDLDWGNTIRSYRINGVDTPWCLDDVTEVVTEAGQNVDVIIVPKVKRPRDIWFIDDLLTHLERKLGLEVGRIGLEVLIEEVEALQEVKHIAAASDRLEAIILGVGDLAASQMMKLGHIGGEAKALARYGGDIWHYARWSLIVVARSAGIDAIDGPYANYGDPEGYEESASTFAMLGGGGKWCIHPSQIEIANSVFAPTPGEIAQAVEAIDAVRAAEAQGLGSASLNGFMIDAATMRLFQVTVDRARLCGLVE